MALHLSSHTFCTTYRILLLVCWWSIRKTRCIYSFMYNLFILITPHLWHLKTGPYTEFIQRWNPWNKKEKHAVVLIQKSFYCWHGLFLWDYATVKCLFETKTGTLCKWNHLKSSDTTFFLNKTHDFHTLHIGIFPLNYLILIPTLYFTDFSHVIGCIDWL